MTPSTFCWYHAEASHQDWKACYSSQANPKSPLEQLVHALLKNRWQQRPSAQQALQMLTSPHSTQTPHPSSQGTTVPPTIPIYAPGTNQSPGPAQAMKRPADFAVGSAPTVPQVKKYGSLQEAQQELQAVVCAMQALLANFDSRAAQLGPATPSGPNVQPSQVSTTCLAMGYTQHVTPS